METILTDTHRLFTTPRNCPTPAPNSWPPLVRNGIWLVKPIPTQRRDCLLLTVSQRTHLRLSNYFAWSTQRHFWICCTSVQVQAHYWSLWLYWEKLLKTNNFVFPFHFTDSALSVAMCLWNSEGERCYVVGPHLLFSLGSSGPGFEGLFSPLLL